MRSVAILVVLLLLCHVAFTLGNSPWYAHLAMVLAWLPTAHMMTYHVHVIRKNRPHRKIRRG